jgi:hypothetical protein
MHRWTKRVLVAVPVLGLLAYASHFTTNHNWDGGFPRGEFRIDVRDPEGKPVPGAVLRCTRRDTGERVPGFLFDNRASEQEPVSDATSRIVAVQPSGPILFGGEAWWLFWVIPMGAHERPKFDYHITATGFKPLKFPLEQLYEPPFRDRNKLPTTKIVRNDFGTETEIELPVSEHTFTLSR